MSDAQPIASYSGLFVASAATCVGLAAAWSNPRRAINRIFFTASLHVSAWLGCLYLSLAVDDGLIWFRITTGVGALVHVHLWLIKETVLNPTEKLIEKLKRGRWWIVTAVGLSVICFTTWFVPQPKVNGDGYYFYISSVIVAYVCLCAQTLRQTRLQRGVQRLELQLLLIGGSATALIVMLLMALHAALRDPWFIWLQPFVVLLFYTATVVVMTTSRVFDARQILFVAAKKVIVVCVVAFAAYWIDIVLVPVLSGPLALLLTVAVALWLASMINRRLDRTLQFYPEGHAVRHAALSAAQRERRIDELEKAFAHILTGWGQAERAVLLSGNKQSIRGNGIELDGDGPIVRALRQLQWVTPERIARERTTPEREALGEFLAARELGVLVIEEGIALTVLIGVGVGASRRPFTYPQVRQLMELSSIMASALERAHFSAKVQHTEQLATVGILGASLAHEIRNPLVSIKTFVQLLPSHHQDANFREKFFKLIGDEVERIDQLTQQLLDLSAPRAYAATEIELHPLLLSSLDLVTAKAAHRDVKFLTEFQASPDRAYTDASAAKQVMLNLCFNAIQAVDSHATEERWVKIATRNTAGGIEMAVADSGPGIAPEIRPKLFQPFQTTKSSGFGLGLAICSDILTNLNASITVDPPEPGRGATFRVTFPCQPLSS